MNHNPDDSFHKVQIELNTNDGSSTRTVTAGCCDPDDSEVDPFLEMHHSLDSLSLSYSEEILSGGSVLSSNDCGEQIRSSRTPRLMLRNIKRRSTFPNSKQVVEIGKSLTGAFSRPTSKRSQRPSSQATRRKSMPVSPYSSAFEPVVSSHHAKVPLLPPRSRRSGRENPARPPSSTSSSPKSPPMIASSPLIAHYSSQEVKPRLLPRSYNNLEELSPSSPINISYCSTDTNNLTPPNTSNSTPLTDTSFEADREVHQTNHDGRIRRLSLNSIARTTEEYVRSSSNCSNSSASTNSRFYLTNLANSPINVVREGASIPIDRWLKSTLHREHGKRSTSLSPQVLQKCPVETLLSSPISSSSASTPLNFDLPIIGLCQEDEVLVKASDNTPSTAIKYSSLNDELHPISNQTSKSSAHVTPDQNQSKFNLSNVKNHIDAYHVSTSSGFISYSQFQSTHPQKLTVNMVSPITSTTATKIATHEEKAILSSQEIKKTLFLPIQQDQHHDS